MRAIENFNGKQRVREFYDTSPEDAYELLKAIAEIHGLESRLKLATPTKQESSDKKLAEEISEEHAKRNSNFSFTKYQITIGAEIEYVNDKNIKCYVIDDRKVKYNGQIRIFMI